MINLIEGQIKIGDRNLLAAFDEELGVLAEGGLIEKRKDTVGPYYYVEHEVDGMRFGVIVSLRDGKVQWLRLHWLDSPMKGWDDVSVEGVKKEYHLLLKIVEGTVGRPPDAKKNNQHSWRFKWGQIDVSFDLRAFQADIFMVPR